MTKKLKRSSQKRTEKAKSCLEEPSVKAQKLKHTRQNIIDSLKIPVNQNCPEFVSLNKKATFEKLNGKVFDKLKEFGRQSFLFLCLNLFI